MAKPYAFRAIVDGVLLPQTGDPRVSVFSQATFGFSAEQMAPEFLLWPRINPGVDAFMRNAAQLGFHKILGSFFERNMSQTFMETLVFQGWLNF